MIVSPTFYVILTAFFFLLFLVLAALLEKRKRPILTFLEKRIPLLVKIPRDTVIKGLTIAGFILFSRKLIYYVPILGVMQTKFSIWWLDKIAVVVLLVCAVVLMVSSGILISKLSIKELKGGCFPILMFLLVMTIFVLLKIKDVSIMRYFLLAFFSPLLLLKVLCSGKYLGFLTSFLLGMGCSIFVRNKKKSLPLQDAAINTGAVLTAVILLLVILSNFILGNIPGDWRGRFQRSVQSVKSEQAVEKLLDIVFSMINSSDKAFALKSLTAAGNIQWQKNTCQRVVRAASTIESSKERSIIIKELALTVAKTDISGAISVAKNIPVKDIRNNVLKELREKIEKK